MADLPTKAFYATELKLMLNGVSRIKKHKVSQAHPISLEILSNLAKLVLHEDSLQSTCWSAIIVAYFCMLRASNLVPKT